MSQMQEENQQSEKKFQLFEEWHRNKPGQKIYKIRIYMISHMVKAEEKLRMKYERNPNLGPPSSATMSSRSGNSLDEDLFEQMTQQDHIPTNAPNTANRDNLNSANRQPPAQQKPIKIFQDFKNRGKNQHMKFHFSKEKQRITIIISAKYFINELKLKEFDLLMVYQSFTKIWTEEYLQIMQTFIKYSKQFKTHDFIKFEFVAIDILGVTFEIGYSNKYNDKILELKRFRFRYSPFQFRQNPYFEDKNTQQIISFIEIHPNNISNVSYNDFYTNMRLGFIDDINNNSSDLWKRMIMRFWVFYQLHCLNRGISDFEEFNKKTLGRVHLHSIRMKKFQLIFPFPLLNKIIIDQKKEGVLYFTFYLDDSQVTVGQNGLQFKLNVNLVQHYSILTFEQKKEIFKRLEKEDSFVLIEKPDLKFNELFEFWMVLKFDDKISKAFAKFETIVSYMIDKIAFNEPPKYSQRTPQDQSQTQKIVEIYGRPSVYRDDKYRDTHQLVLEIKHKHSILSQVPNISLPRYIDETSFYKLSKKKNKFHLKEKKEESSEKVDMVINEDLKRYITQVLKTKPLRECYREVMEYIERVVKIIYKPFNQGKVIQKVDTREMAVSLIITNIMKLLEVGNHHARKSEITIITEDDPLFVKENNQQDLVAEVTFNIKDLKIYWIKRLPEGYIIVRMFEKHIEIVKDLNLRTSIEIDYSNIQKTNEQLMQELKNILMKEFAALHNMMI